MLPTVFAIFVVCSSDLLFCVGMDMLTRSFEQDIDRCQEYVELVEGSEDKNANIVMGKCVWKFNDGGDHE